MPKCEEVFDSCFWHGTQINCCEEFLLQRTEQGFCWSFNSFTSENTSNWSAKFTTIIIRVFLRIVLLASILKVRLPGHYFTNITGVVVSVFD